MNLHKIWLIARREYLFNIRRRMYLFTVFVLPVISIGLSALASNFAAKQFDDVGTFHHIGIVDQTPTHLMNTVRLPLPYQLVDENAAAGMLQSNALDLYYVVPSDYLITGHIRSFSKVSVAPGRDDEFMKLVRRALVANVSDPALIARLETPVQKLQLRRPGDPQPYDETVLFSAFLVPFAFGFVLFLSINTTAQYLMSGVAEEKENRMMELFITSSRPSEMLWGKLLGLGTLGLTQIVIWAFLALTLESFSGSFNLSSVLTNLQLTPGVLVIMLLFFVFGYLLYGSIMAGIGVIGTAEQDSRQIAGIVTLISILPFVLVIVLISDPNGSLPVIMSLFPLTAPLTMIMRIGFGPVPTWQIALSACFLILSAFATVWLSARLFRIGMLSYGKRMNVREILSAIREGREVIKASTSLEKEEAL